MYRTYNEGQGDAPNQPYANSFVVRTAMLGKGWVPEGQGEVGVIGCVPSARVQ